MTGVIVHEGGSLKQRRREGEPYRDKVRGCLIGGAVGDTLGHPDHDIQLFWWHPGCGLNDQFRGRQLRFFFSPNNLLDSRYNYLIQCFSQHSVCEFCFIRDGSVKIHSEQRNNRCEGSRHSTVFFFSSEPQRKGEHAEEKDIILDVNVCLNDEKMLDLEMQVADEKNWTERSLYYACRNYTELVKGGNYRKAMPSIHIGLLDFTLFKEHEKFYATYRLLEEKDHYPYTDKLQIGVVDLTRIDLATTEDQEYNIDKWARLFKAKTWEDIRMVAAKNQMIDDAATTIYQLTADERIRQQCEAREDYLRRQRGIQQMLEEQKNQLEEQKNQLEAQKSQLEAQGRQLTEKDRQLTEKEQQIAEQRKIIEELQKKLRIEG